MDINPTYTGETGPTQEPRQSQKREGAGYCEYLKVIGVTLLIALFLKTFVVEAFRIPTGSMENTLLVGDFLIVNKIAYGLRTPKYLPLTNVAMPTLTVPFIGHVHRGDVVVFEFPGSPDEVKPSETVNYVKRCIGLPGDTVRIDHGRVLVNNVPMGLPAHARPAIEYFAPRGSRRFRMYPPGSRFSEFNYGPLAIPKRGDVIALDSASIQRWKVFIEREGHSVGMDSDRKILVDGRPTDSYFVQRDYYIMMGDNRGNSLDSRFWGFVPDDNIVGEALVVYWSWDPELSVGSVLAKMHSIRWGRIGTFIK